MRLCVCECVGVGVGGGELGYLLTYCLCYIPSFHVIGCKTKGARRRGGDGNPLWQCARERNSFRSFSFFLSLLVGASNLDPTTLCPLYYYFFCVVLIRNVWPFSIYSALVCVSVCLCKVAIGC